MPDPLVLAADVEAEHVEKRSRFHTRLHRVTSLDDVDRHLRQARLDHPDARHRCTALVIGGTDDAPPVHRSSDDGEPSGTAGVPMLQSLLHAHLTDTLAITIRYFGGIKLGAGGLVRAYTASVERAISAATLLRRATLAVARIEVALADAGTAEHAVRTWADAHDATVEPTEYGARGAVLTVLVDPELVDALASDTARWSSGRAHLERAGTTTADVPLHA
ncbi:IMPACT family protein [Brachybacterium sp. AOP25-B2-12]|uniref:IMPACT family protein n=1 Tax=Brachybacterium sp. AOP25-B2-12 TaxID=3457710 RepID=UPI00403339BC